MNRQVERDMNWKTLVTAVALSPIVAFLGGVGFLFWQIGQSWDSRSTDSLIAGLVATCGGGAMVVSLLLAIIVGIPFGLRILTEASYAHRAWREPAGTQWRALPPKPPSWAEQPPQIEDKRAGQWLTQGTRTYDVWDDDTGESEGENW
jgi:hypothetical protein